MTLEIRRIEWHAQRVLDRVAEAERRANERAGHKVLEDAVERVPYRTGELAASATLEINDEGAAIGFTAEHAPFVRAKGRALGGRDPRWLDSAIEADAADVGAIYADEIRSGWPGG